MTGPLASPSEWDADEESQYYEISRHGLAAVAIGAFVLAIVCVDLRATPNVPPNLLRAPIVTIPPIVLGFTFVPGLLFLLLVNDDDVVGAGWVAYAGGLSLLLMMGVGLLINVLLPPLGISDPLAATWYVPAMTLLVAGLAIACFERIDGSASVRIPARSPLAPAPLFFLSLPLLSVIAIEYMNRTGDNGPLLLVYAAIAAVPLLLWLFVDRAWHALGLWSMAGAILASEGLKAGASFPGNPVVVFTWIAGRWVPGTNEEMTLSTELLQHGTIFPGFANLANIDIMTQMAHVNPFFVSLLPIALYAAFRQHVESKIAVLGTSIFVFSHPFYNQYVMGGRAGTPVIFVSLFALAMSDRNLSRTNGSLLAVLFGMGIVFTHYGTSYFVMAALVAAAFLLVGMWLLDTGLRTVLGNAKAPLASAGDSLTDRPWGPGLSISYLSFYVAATFSWFMFINGGRAFGLFPRQFASVLRDLLTSSESTGRTAARLERDYGSAVIEISKQIYLLIAALTALGLVIALLKRYEGELLDLSSRRLNVQTGFRDGEERWGGTCPFGDRYLVIGAAMLAIFGSTLMFRTWGGGRPMMISFVFTTVFAAYAVVSVGRGFDAIAERARIVRPGWLQGERVAGVAFAVLLAAMFLLNSGAASAALGLDDRAPSGTPIPGDNSLETDVATHAWVIDHNSGMNVYGDFIAFGHTDWRLPAIAARTEGLNRYGPERPKGQLAELTKPGATPGYILMLKHNVESGNLSMYLESKPIDVIREEYRENVVYSSGHSRVHYIPSAEQPANETTAESEQP